MCFLPPAIIHGSEFNNLLVSQQSKVPCLPIWQPELPTAPISTAGEMVQQLRAFAALPEKRVWSASVQVLIIINDMESSPKGSAELF